MPQGARGEWKVTRLLLPSGIRWGIQSTNAPTNGSTGTGNGKAAPGSLCQNAATGDFYINVGTKVAPVWSPLNPITFNVSAAQIIAMNGAPVNLIAAPPAGYCIIVDNIMIEMNRTATAFTGGGAVNLQYTGAAQAHTGTLPAAVVTTGGAGTVLTQLGPATGASGTTVPTATGIDITNATGAFAAGTGTMKVMIDYRIIKQ